MGPATVDIVQQNIVILDTELTGTDIEKSGDRIVSLGLVFLGQNPSEDIVREWFFNPGKPSGPDGLRVHGLTQEFLAGFPDFTVQFNDIARFIGQSTIVHHCWFRESDDKSVDERALNAEFARAGGGDIAHNRWVNLKKIAIALSPDANSLNDMLDRFGIDRSQRGEKHGALTDALLTASLFRKMRQSPETSRLIPSLLLS